MVKIPDSPFPVALDSDYTLFHVFNSTQSVLDKPLSSDATTIEIHPVSANDPDVWPDNGFAALPNELVYYDAVEKNESGKVISLLRCIRGYDGKANNYNKGTPVYGNVVAELHNQLAQAIVNIENTVGDLVDATTSFDSDVAETETGKFAMNMSSALTSIYNAAPTFDDACPDVEFVFNLLGSTAEFCVIILGSFNSYRLDFGDGQYTTTQYSGTHTYSNPGLANPYVTVTSNSCCITQQPTNSYSDGMPFPSVTSINPLVVTIPEVPDFPNFVTPGRICPGPLFNLPPLLVQNNCVECSPISSSSSSIAISSIDICSVLVSIVGCCLPSHISIVGCCPPSEISLVGCPSSISVTGFNLPETISVTGCCIPETISVIGVDNIPKTISFIGCCDIPSIIEFGNIPSFSLIEFGNPPSFTPIGFQTPPTININWGVPPTVSCVITVQCPSTTSTMGMMNPMMGFADDVDSIPVNVDDLGIPSEIRILAPKIDDIRLVHNLPAQIEIKSAPLPDIKIIGPIKPLPEKIEIVHTLPTQIHLVAQDVPATIKLDATEVPRSIMLVPAPDFPSSIQFNASIQVTGIPNSIEVVHNLPSAIRVEVPKDVFIPVRFDGPPIPLDTRDLLRALSEIIIARPN